MGKVCDICGCMGFSNALLECSECSIVYAHQYCLGIPPGAIDDTFDWVCEFCSVPIESESCQNFGDRSEIVALPEQPEPLCALPPVQYHESSTTEYPCNLSKLQEASISSFMEHSDSIMRGLVLLVSPSGKVFIDKEKSFRESSCFSSVACHLFNMTRRSNKLGSYKAKRELSPLGKTVENCAGVTRTLELQKSKLQSPSEINAHLCKPANGLEITGYSNSDVDGCEGKDDTPLFSASSKLDASLESSGEIKRLSKSFDYPEESELTSTVGGKAEVWNNHSVGSIMEDPIKGKRKRTLEPEVEVIQRNKATDYKVEVSDEGSSSGPWGNSNGKHELINRKTKRGLSLRTALAYTQRSVRNQIVALLLSAGWTVEYRTRKHYSKAKVERVYISPQGTVYWSAPKAYRRLEQDVMKAKAKESENGDGNGNSNLCFEPLPKEFLSLLSDDNKKKRNTDML